MGKLIAVLTERVKRFAYTFSFQTLTANDRFAACLVENDLERLVAYERFLTKKCNVPDIDFVVNFLRYRGYSDSAITSSDMVIEFIDFYTALRDASHRYQPKSTAYENTAELYFTMPERRDEIGSMVRERGLYTMDSIMQMIQMAGTHHGSLSRGTL